MSANENTNDPQQEQPTRELGSTAPAPVTDRAAPRAPIEAPAPIEEKRLSARVSTIVWGVLLLGFCAYTGTIALGGTVPNPIAWVTTALIVGGIALVAVGIAAAVRKR